MDMVCKSIEIITWLYRYSIIWESSLYSIFRKMCTWFSWWRHQMETFSALLALCVGNSPVTGEFPSQRPVLRSFDVFFDLRLNKRLSKQWWARWFETPSRSLWRYCDGWALVCSGYIMTSSRIKTIHFPTFFRVPSRALWQSYGCPRAHARSNPAQYR